MTPVYFTRNLDKGVDTVVRTSPYLKESHLSYSTGGLVYIYEFNYEPLEYWYGTLRRSDGQFGGFVVRKFKQERTPEHLLVDTKGAPLERVLLPESYINHLEENFKEVINRQDKIINAVAKAEQLEKQFLYKTCERGQKDPSIDNKLQTKICSWVGERGKKLEVAKQQYNKKLEIEAIAKEQERQKFENEMLNRRIAEALEAQAEAAQSANIINGFNQLQQQINQANEASRSRGQHMMFYNQLNQLNQDLNKPTNCITNFGITTCF